MPKFTKGSAVQQVLPAPIVGTVTGFDVDQETGDLQYLVEWTDADGVAHHRHFVEDHLQGVAPQQ